MLGEVTYRNLNNNNKKYLIKRNRRIGRLLVLNFRQMCGPAICKFLKYHANEKRFRFQGEVSTLFSHITCNSFSESIQL